MSEEETLKLDAQQEAAQSALRELGHPVVSDEFRRRLRAEFVSGELVPARRRRSSIVRMAIPIAAAIAAVFVVAFFNQGASWE